MPSYLLDRCVEGELWDIWTSIAHDNPDAATRVIEAVYETCLTISAHPHTGRARKFKNPRLRGIRSIPVAGFNNYLIFYRPVREGVQIHHVYHGARDLDALLGEK
ncbi:MAG TPA: type II toxin-antitoxin system RelE/ParE family toxin [Opitutaceae bacterium]